MHGSAGASFAIPLSGFSDVLKLFMSMSDCSAQGQSQDVLRADAVQANLASRTERLVASGPAHPSYPQLLLPRAL